MPDVTWKSAIRARSAVLAGGFLVTVVMCAVATQLVPPRYELTASVLLLPTTQAAGVTSNPYLSLGGLQATADVVARTLTDQDTVRAVERQVGTDTYTVARDVTTAGPVLLITSDGASPQAAARLLNAVLEVVPRNVTTLQEAAGVPAAARFRASVISRDNQPKRLVKAVVRAVLVTAAAGLVLTSLLAAALEGLVLPSRTRSSRRTSPAPPQQQAQPGPAEGTPSPFSAQPDRRVDHQRSHRDEARRVAPSVVSGARE